jgi:hypothetical protein
MAEIEERFCPERYLDEDWFAPTRGQRWERHTQAYVHRMLADMWEYPEAAASVFVAEPPLTLTTEQQFQKLASEWSNETRNVSSLTALVSHPKYRQIIDLGWDVVPYLIDDLQKNKRYWLAALDEITKIRPYDSADEGNSNIIIDSWVKWGKKKYKSVR